MNRVLAAALVTLAAAQAVAWGRLGLLDRENGRLRAALTAAERRAASTPESRRLQARPAVATRFEPAEEEAVPAAEERPSGTVAEPQMEVQADAQVKKRQVQTQDETLESRLGLTDSQRAWLELLRRGWAGWKEVYRDVGWITNAVQRELEALSDQYEESFRSLLTPEQLIKYRCSNLRAFQWTNLMGC